MADDLARLDAISSDPVTMGWMVGSPPPPDKMVRFATARLRVFRARAGRIRTCANCCPPAWSPAAMRRSARCRGPLRDDLDGVTFTLLGGGRTMTWADSLGANFTDGIVILHKGQRRLRALLRRARRVHASTSRSRSPSHSWRRLRRRSCTKARLTARPRSRTTCPNLGRAVMPTRRSGSSST